jgi:hypothetical protein
MMGQPRDENTFHCTGLSQFLQERRRILFRLNRAVMGFLRFMLTQDGVGYLL